MSDTVLRDAQYRNTQVIVLLLFARRCCRALSENVRVRRLMRQPERAIACDRNCANRPTAVAASIVFVPDVQHMLHHARFGAA